MNQEIKKELDRFMKKLEKDEDKQVACLEVKKEDEVAIYMIIGEEEYPFTITCPQSKSEKFFFFSEENDLHDLIEQVNQQAEKKGSTLSSLLTHLVDLYLKENEGKQEEEDEEDEDNELYDDDVGLNFKEEAPKPKKTKEEQEIDEKVDRGKFLEIGSPQATLRLIKDLKNLQKAKPETLGFLAEPVKVKGEYENLYHWHVKLTSFDKDTDLYKDMMNFKKKTGQDHILLEMRFSSEYPHVPPFIRVVRPRFAFRTGHVTIGGSICMELLTKSGWSSTNDIESILIQIVAELVSGGARLDASNTQNYEYSESEAWDAFYRAARTHGWEISGLSSSMFPKV